MKSLLSVIFALVLLFGISPDADAQYRNQVPSLDNYSGPVVNSKTLTIQSALSDFFREKVKMSHSYSMSFGSYGGSYQNVNAYTNTMQVMFSDRLTGRLDVSFMHSPFGGSNMINTDNSMGGEILIRNAELNYKISDNAHIRFQYQQMPRNFGYMNGYGNPYGFNRYGSGLWY